MASRLRWTPCGQQDVEVALGDVRAGVADLVGAPAACEGAFDLAGRAGVDADAPRLAGRPSARKTSSTSGSGFAFSANRSRNGSPVRASAGGARGRSPRSGPGRRRTAACRARAPAPRRRGRRSEGARQRCRARDEPTSGLTRRSPGGCGGRVLVRVRVRMAAASRSPASSGRGLPRRRRRTSRAIGRDDAAISAMAASKASGLRADGVR